MPHTPGPWRVIPLGEYAEEYDIVGPRHVDDDDCEYISMAYGGGDAGSNARLIAQAPAMYELLKGVEWAIVDCYEDTVVACPSCRKMECFGHADDCRLAAVLKSVEGEA